jgi:hypothetical protein
MIHSIHSPTLTIPVLLPLPLPTANRYQARASRLHGRLHGLYARLRRTGVVVTAVQRTTRGVSAS